MTQRLKNKIALITGASRGLGAAVAKRFAQEGAQLILIGRDVAALEEVDDIVQQYGPPALLVPFDLTDLLRFDDLAKSLAERFGCLDILVGNAAILGDATPMTHVTPTAWHKIMTTNLHVNWHLLRAVEPLLIEAQIGRLIFVTSDVATMPTAYRGPYAVSKAALEAMVKNYALEVKHRNFRINLIDPGGLRTDMGAEWMGGKERASVLPLPESVTEAFVLCAEEGCPYHEDVIKAQEIKRS
ncbi:MAG: SDR family NAD(P)-dependent oxidoreductase [Alphaproteobacteria bacterium]|nr:SDR family NAD(P)-dependent oxidoreductase [Alphaproteobacteria bacterium]